MKKILKSACAACLLAASIGSAAEAATLSGTLNLTITGTLAKAGTGFTSAYCNAKVFLIPAANSTTSVAAQIPNPWLLGGYQQANASAAFPINGLNLSTTGSSMTGTAPVVSGTAPSAGSATGFTCLVSVPYTFPNAAATASTQNLMIIYTVSVTNSVGFLTNTTNPTAPVYTTVVPTYPGGKTTQTTTIAVPPVNGTTTAQSVTLKL